MRILIETVGTHVNSNAHSVFQIEIECDYLLIEVRNSSNLYNLFPNLIRKTTGVKMLRLRCVRWAKGEAVLIITQQTPWMGSPGVHLQGLPMSVPVVLKKGTRHTGRFIFHLLLVWPSPLNQTGGNFKLETVPGSRLSVELVLT